MNICQKLYFFHLKKIAMRTKCGEDHSHVLMLMSQTEVDHIQSLLCHQCWRNSKTRAHLTLLLLGLCHLFNLLRQQKFLSVPNSRAHLSIFPFLLPRPLFCCPSPSKELCLVLILLSSEISLCSSVGLKLAM